MCLGVCTRTGLATYTYSKVFNHPGTGYTIESSTDDSAAVLKPGVWGFYVKIENTGTAICLLSSAGIFDLNGHGTIGWSGGVPIVSVGSSATSSTYYERICSCVEFSLHSYAIVDWSSSSPITGSECTITLYADYYGDGCGTLPTPVLT